MPKYRLELTKKRGWMGFSKYPNSTTTFGTYMTHTGRFYTGLNDAEVEKLSKRSGLEPDSLKAPSDIDPKVGSYWKTFSLKVGTKGLDLDTDNDPLDDITFHFLKNHHWVAYNIPKPSNHHKFILLNAEEEAEAKVKKADKKMAAVMEFQKMSSVDYRRCLRIAGTNPDRMSDVLVKSKLIDIVENDPEKFNRIWVNNKDRELEFELQQAIQHGEVTKESTVHKNSSGEVIGYNQEEALNYLRDPKNKEWRNAVKANIATKIKKLT